MERQQEIVKVNVPKALIETNPRDYILYLLENAPKLPEFRKKAELTVYLR